ncbi:hypothetical protein Psyaliredsea_32340 [Psychrobacter alimentarius]
MTPTCAKPFAPPPPNTKATLGASAAFVKDVELVVAGSSVLQALTGNTNIASILRRINAA